MFKFRGFKASFDFVTGKQRGLECELTPASINGAYRTSKDEFNNNDYTYSPPRRLAPSMVQLPPSRANQSMKPSKSLGDLSKTSSPNQNLTRSSYNLSINGNQVSKIQSKEQKKLEKQQMLEQKKQEKIAAKEKQRQEKLAKEKHKQEKSAKITPDKPETKNKASSKKKSAPKPPETTNNQVMPIINNRPIVINTPLAPNQMPENTQSPPVNQIRQPYSTNTLESSISRSTGPPPYGEFPEIVNESDNVTFGKPIVDSSWDLISQHREQMNKPTATVPVVPRRKKDLQYNVGNLRVNDKNNSEA